jgi:tubulin beta
MQAGQCDNQMGFRSWEVACGEHGIGGGGEHRGDNDAHFGRIKVFYQVTSCGKYVPRAVIMNLEPGVIGA